MTDLPRRKPAALRAPFATPEALVVTKPSKGLHDLMLVLERVYDISNDYSAAQYEAWKTAVSAIHEQYPVHFAQSDAVSTYRLAMLLAQTYPHLIPELIGLCALTIGA